MPRSLLSIATCLGVLLSWNLAGLTYAQQYAVDAAHAAATFQVSHLGLSWTHGRFNNMAGEFTVDTQAPEQSTFVLTIAADSIDTGNQQRDDHLRSPDFFNVKQFPEITFESTKVEPIEDGYQVTGNLTMHGETKEVSFDLLGGRTAELPPGTQRTGFSTALKVKRSDFGVGEPSPAIGDEVHVAISFEGVRQ